MTNNEMIDLTQDRAKLHSLYASKPGEFVRVDVPTLPFAVLDGEGPPERSSIEKAVKVLFTAIYPIRREARAKMGKSFVEPPVEILYWAEDMRDIATGQRDKWHWRVQITLPVWTDPRRLEDSVTEMRGELGQAPAPRWEAVKEGDCVQLLHTGSPSDLPTKLTALYADYLPQHRLEPVGPYHEVYLDDWSRVSREQRKIIVRTPVRETE